MRSRWVERRRQSMSRGLGIPRLTSAIVMLAVVGMLIYRAGEPSTWRWLAPEPDAEEQATGDPQGTEGSEARAGTLDPSLSGDQTSGKDLSRSERSTPEGKEPPGKLAPTGPTDEDPDEQDQIQEAREGITDGTISILPEEMIAYKHVLTWVHNQSMALMSKRAKKGLVFHDFITDPDQLRFKLVELEMNVARVRPIPERTGLPGQPLYEVWGSTKDSGSWLYTAVVQGLPKGMPTGERVQERARVTGYFFKIEGYLPGKAMPGDRTDKAPVIIGRLVWQASPLTRSDPSTNPWYLTIALVAIAVVIIGGVSMAMLVSRRHSVLPPRVYTGSDPDAPVVDEWLAQAEAGGMIGNKISANGESNNGHADTEHSEQEEPGIERPPRFSDGSGKSEG